jgi:hypothetical protein
MVMTTLSVVMMRRAFAASVACARMFCAARRLTRQTLALRHRSSLVTHPCSLHSNSGGKAPVEHWSDEQVTPLLQFITGSPLPSQRSLPTPPPSLLCHVT